MKETLRRFFRRAIHSQYIDAVIRCTPYGAEAELADGSLCSFYQSRLSEPAIEAAICWAREQGAKTINISR